MKLSIFKKVIREVVREEIEYSIKGLRKELKEVLVSSISDKMLEESTPKTTGKPVQNSNLTTANTTAKKPRSIEKRVPMTKNSILNDILQETANDGEWKNINKEAEVKSVTEETAGLPDHLANALNKDYSGVMKAVEEKAKFKNGA